MCEVIGKKRDKTDATVAVGFILTGFEDIAQLNRGD